MVDKIKSAFFGRGWEILITALLTIIIAGLGWFINRITNVQEQQDELLTLIHDRQNGVIRVVAKDCDTSPDDKRELQSWLFPTRSGGGHATTNTLIK
jgi:hypothetical protein